jgi:quercetin dioxygenase-like cupin family protein
MIKRRQEMTVEPRFEVKGGRGGYDSTHIFEQSEVAKTTLFAVNTLPPGSSIGVHPHQEEGEAYIVLSGKATVTEDGQDYLLGPGDAEYCTGGHTHGIANDSDEPLAFLAIIMR